MIINDLIQKYNIHTDINDLLKNHKIEIIVPPVDKYEYVQDGKKHILTSKTGKVTDSITIDDEEKTVTVLKESEGLPDIFYTVHEDGSEDIS